MTTDKDKKKKSKDKAYGSPPPRRKHVDISEFSNFEILWFDLSTKVREMYQELNQPLIDKVYDQKHLLDQMFKHSDVQDANIQKLDDTVHEKTEALDVFQKIFSKIAQVEEDRKTIEMRLEANVDSVMKTFAEYQFKFQQNDKQFKTMVSLNSQHLFLCFILNFSILL